MTNRLGIFCFVFCALVDKYFGQHTGPVYWAVWTDLAE